MADKIVSWGGIDSKGTSGMGVTGSLAVSGSIVVDLGGIGSGAIDGLLLQNTASATSGTQQRSPSLHFKGASWNDTSGGRSQQADFNIQYVPNSPDGNGSGTLTFFGQASGSTNDSLLTLGTGIGGSAKTVTVTAPGGFIANGSFNTQLSYVIVSQNISQTSAGQTSYFLGKLGVGLTSPTAQFQVKGSGTTSSTTALLVQNANASSSLQVKDDLTSTFGGSMTVISNDYAGIDLRRTVPNSQSWLQLYATGDFNPVLFKTQGVDWLGYVRSTTNIFLNRGNQVALNDNSGVSPTGSIISSDIHIYNATNSPKLVFWSPFSVQTPRGQISTSDGTSRGGNLIFSVNNNNLGLSALTEYMRITQTGNVGIGTPTPSASLHISGSSNSTLLKIDSPSQNNILYVSGSGAVGIGTSTTYGLQVANTSSLIVSATGWTPTTFSTASAAVSITPNIYVTAGNRSYYSLYVANPGITISGSFGNYDFRSLYAAGKIDAVGGINAGDSRFYATSNAVSFQGYNPYDGNTGDAAGGITFTSRQVAGGDEAGIGAYYGAGSRLYIYNKYNASDSKIIFSVGGTIRSSFFGTGNLSIGNGETDMSARLGVKGSGTTASTTSLLVQNSAGTELLSVRDDQYVLVPTLQASSQVRSSTIVPLQNQNLTLTATWADSTAVNIETITNKAQVLIVRPASNLTLTSGTHDTQRITHTFAPTSGTGVVNALTLNQTINQTGGANGITRGLYVNPIITASADFRAIETTSGSVVFNGGNVGIGTSSPSASLHVAGNTIITGSLTVSLTTTGSSENTLTLGPAPAGGAGEGGQLGFNATGGTYTSASFIDLWQNKLRVLKGTNAGSTAEVANFDLQTLYLNLPGGAVTMPQRPAFRVTGSSGYNPTANTVISGSSVGIDYNQGGYYNNTNGEFTCPVAGLYHVWYVGRTYAASLASVALYKNNTGTPLAFWESNANSGHFGTSAVVSLAVNDIITAKVTAGQVTFDGNDNWGAAYIG